VRVLLLNPYLPPPRGGIEKEMLAVAGELAALGHEPLVLTTTARFPAGENPPPEGLPAGVAVVRRRGFLRTTLSGFAPSRAPLLVPGLAAAADRFQADLVLVYNAGWGPALGPVLRRLGRRAPTLYRTYFHPPGGRLAGLKTRYILGTARLADRVLVATSAERDVLAASGRLDPARIEVVPPGVARFPDDPAAVARLERAHRLAGKTVIAHVARLGRFKGTHDLIAVLPDLLRDTGRDVVLLLVGGSPERADLERLAKDLGVGDAVRFAGDGIDDRTLAHLLDLAQVLALPSAYEAYGFVFVEALARGVPCVGCDVGGVREAVGEGGILIPRFGDRAALATALVRLLGDETLRRSLGARGRERVLATLTWRKTAERFLAIGAEVRAAATAGRASG
jgi:glycosyltransferase involved in cell wall biosynthesis